MIVHAQCGRLSREAARGVQNGNHPHAGHGACLHLGAAQAVTGQDALLLFGHDMRQAIAAQQHVALIGHIRPANGHRVGLRNAPHVLGKAVCQLLQGLGTGHEGGHLVQRTQTLLLGLQAGGLITHLRLKVAIERLQVLRHAVEAIGERTHFVHRIDDDTCGEVALLDVTQSRFEAGNRLQNDHIARVHQRQGTQNGQHHHGQLEGPQQRGPPRKMALDRRHKQIHLSNQIAHVRAQTARWRRPIGNRQRLRTQPLPIPHHALELRAGVSVPRHRQRTRGVSAPQQGHAPIKLGQLRRHLGRKLHSIHRLLLQAERQLVTAHAHAPRLIDGGRTTLQLPGHPQRQTNGGQRQHQKHPANRHELACQAHAPKARTPTPMQALKRRIGSWNGLIFEVNGQSGLRQGTGPGHRS